MFEIRPEKFKKISVGVDDAPGARAAFSCTVGKVERNGSELRIVLILETDRVNVYQILGKDYIRGSEDELRQRVNEYTQATIDYGVDPEKITAIVDRGERPAERIYNHVIPALQPDLSVAGSVGKKGSRKAVGSQASYMTRHAGASVFVIQTNTVQTYE